LFLNYGIVFIKSQALKAARIQNLAVVDEYSLRAFARGVVEHFELSRVDLEVGRRKVRWSFDLDSDEEFDNLFRRHAAIVGEQL
jgi:hypothetical protein